MQKRETRNIDHILDDMFSSLDSPRQRRPKSGPQPDDYIFPRLARASGHPIVLKAAKKLHVEPATVALVWQWLFDSPQQRLQETFQAVSKKDTSHVIWILAKLFRIPKQKLTKIVSEFSIRRKEMDELFSTEENM